MEEIQELLSNIYTDFKMLKEGAWVPDEASCKDSIEVVEAIALKLNLQIHDTRED